MCIRDRCYSFNLFFSSRVFGLTRQSAVMHDDNASIEPFIKSLLSSMTLEEKVRQLDMYRGSDFLENGLFSANKTLSIVANMSIGAIHDLYPPSAEIINQIQEVVMENSANKIPVLFLEECLHGLNGNGKTVFPQSIGLSSTWDVELIRRVGEAIGSETRAYGIGLCLSPVLGVSRDPRWGRTQETYGEDTHLNSRIGTAMIQGLQGLYRGGLSSNQSVVSNPKHFAAHSIPEAGHNIAPAHVGERELLEVFLPVFKAAVEDGQCLGLMAAYSEIDGIPNCANEELLTDRLREEWGFSGMVISDLGAINMLYELHKVVASQSEAILTFLSSGGNMQFYDFSHEFYQQTIIESVKSGLFPESILDSRVADVLRIKTTLGLMDNWYTPVELVDQHVNSKENQNLALEAALKSIILLKNENNILPLDTDTLSSIAVIGPNADVMRFGDYSGEGVVSNFVTVLEGIRSIVGDKVQIRQAWGSNVDVSYEMQPIRPYYLQSNSELCEREVGGLRDSGGLYGEYFDNWYLDGEPAFTRVDEMVFFNWYYYGPDNLLNRVNNSRFSVRWTGCIVPSITVFNGSISAQTNGDGVRLWLDNTLVIDTWTNQSNPSSAQLNWEAERPYHIKMEYFRNQSSEVTLGWNLVGQNAVADAVICSLSSDVVIAVLGDYQADDGEGLDEASLDLPGNQEPLVEALIETGVPVIVVLINGRPLSTPFIASNASAIIEAWYPGQATGTAIGHVLFGLYNPGSLPLVVSSVQTNTYSKGENYQFQYPHQLGNYQFFTIINHLLGGQTTSINHASHSFHSALVSPIPLLSMQTWT
eukprot:TRINITY_DN2138_c0_g1_i3.p1 TRINITY_DN2138_c0_g1~~TRINITY_DN2138_c0_g1_i3.p1  ORF type:complete len:816 (+),score=53.05 TRINITY_DN2138_c0_g1_i3:31-2478(+)